MPAISVTKCHGSGNDFVLLDDRAGDSRAYPQLARALCDRRLGVGADGLLVLTAARGSSDVAMRIFNADGSEAEMCGNGVRCVARYIARKSGRDKALTIETLAGIVRTEPAGGQVRVDMGKPVLAAPLHTDFRYEGKSMRFARISLGTPHAVIFDRDPPESFDIEALAATVTRSANARDGINVEIANAGAQDVRMRVFERGVGETLACGTGAGAVAVAAIVEGRAKSPVDVVQRGGSVTVQWQGEGASLYLTGPAELVFDTTVTL